MLLEFLVDYSRDPELRNEFNHQPAKVFDRYEVSQEDRGYLQPYNRDRIAARLHEQIDEALRAHPVNYGWSYGYPTIVGDPQPSQGAVGESLSITIEATALTNQVSVEFFNADDKVTAKVIKMTSSAESFTVLCTATFINMGIYNLAVTNHIRGYAYTSTRPNCFKAK